MFSIRCMHLFFQKALADERIKERDAFCTEVKSFGSQFDLEGQGETKRENKAKEEMEELTKQEELLLKGIIFTFVF